MDDCHFGYIIELNPLGVSHCGLSIYIKKYLKAKQEEALWKFKYFTMQKYNPLQKNIL
jgi:hypothetical protein